MWRQFIPGRWGWKEEEKRERRGRKGEKRNQRTKGDAFLWVGVTGSVYMYMNKTRQVQITIQKMYLGCVCAGCLHLIWKQWQHGKAYPQHPVAPGFRHSATRELPSSGVPAWENIHNHINISWNPRHLVPSLPTFLPYHLSLPSSSQPHLVAQCIGVDRSSPPTAFTSAPFWMM